MMPELSGVRIQVSDSSWCETGWLWEPKCQMGEGDCEDALSSNRTYFNLCHNCPFSTSFMSKYATSQIGLLACCTLHQSWQIQSADTFAPAVSFRFAALQWILGQKWILGIHCINSGSFPMNGEQPVLGSTWEDICSILDLGCNSKPKHERSFSQLPSFSQLVTLLNSNEHI